MRPSQIIKAAVEQRYADSAVLEISKITKTAALSVCKEIISTCKQLIKNRKIPPSGKLVALEIFNAGMMAKNTEYLLFAQKKIMDRLTIFGSHRATDITQDKGRNLFKPQKDWGEDEYQASAEFLNKLLQYMQTWANAYGKGPDGKDSIFRQSYQQLINKGVTFPQNLRPSSQRQAPQRKRPSNPQPKEPERKREQGLTEQMVIEKSKEVENTVQLISELASTGNSDMLSEMRTNLQTLSDSINSYIQIASASDNDSNLMQLIQLNEMIQNGFDILQHSKQEYASPPVSNRSSNAHILDLNSPAQSQNYQTYVPQSNQDLLAGVDFFGGGGFNQYSTGMVGMQPQFQQSMQSNQENDIKIKQLETENSQLKQTIKDQQQMNSQMAAQLQEIMGKYKEALNTIQQLRTQNQYNTYSPMGQNLLSSPSQMSRSTNLMQNLPPSPLQSGNDYQQYNSVNSNSSQGINLLDMDAQLSPQLMPPPLQNQQIDIKFSQSSSSSPRGEHDEVPLKCINETFFQQVCIVDKGVLFDDSFIQAGIMLKIQGNQGQGFIYIGNKSQQQLNDVLTDLINVDNGLQIQIDKSREGGNVQYGQQINRKLLFNVNGVYHRLPQLKVVLEFQDKPTEYILKLPIPIARFLTPIELPQMEIYQKFQQSHQFNKQFYVAKLGQHIKSLQDIVKHAKVCHNFTTVTASELSELPSNQVISCAKKEELFVFVQILMNSSGGVMINCRCVNPELSESVGIFFVQLLN